MPYTVLKKLPFGEWQTHAVYPYESKAVSVAEALSDDYGYKVKVIDNNNAVIFQN